MAFCTSLRRRPSFAKIIPALVSNGFLKENQLDTHDIAITLENAGSVAKRQLRFLLLSQHAVENGTMTATLARIRRFFAITGGADIAILFLLGETGAHGTSNLLGYNRLQVEIVRHADLAMIPILPLATLSMLPELLQGYCRSVSKSRPVPQQRGFSTFARLRQCTISPPMNESLAYFITDIFGDLRELAVACCEVSTHELQRSGLDGPSPYFSSSSEQPMSDSLSKLQRLRAFDTDGTMDMIEFWQNC